MSDMDVYLHLFRKRGEGQHVPGRQAQARDTAQDLDGGQPGRFGAGPWRQILRFDPQGQSPGQQAERGLPERASQEGQDARHEEGRPREAEEEEDNGPAPADAPATAAGDGRAPRRSVPLARLMYLRSEFLAEPSARGQAPRLTTEALARPRSTGAGGEYLWPVGCNPVETGCGSGWVRRVHVIRW